MKKILNYILPIFAITAITVSCSEWTQPEPAMPTDRTKNIHGEDYYANIRAYRASEHQVMFGFFMWGGATSNLKYSLMGLPDSMDIVSLWGNWSNLTQAQIDDLEKAHRLKDIKVVFGFILFDIGTQLTPSWVSAASESNPVEIDGVEYTNNLQARRAFWGMHPDDGKGNTTAMDEMALRACEKYADALCDTIKKYNYDGFDWDFEIDIDQGGYYASGDLIGGSRQSYINDTQAAARTRAFAKRMRENLGDKLFMINGNCQNLKAKDVCLYFDYFTSQFYSRWNTTNVTASGVQSEVNRFINAFSSYLDPEFIASRTILCESMEDSYLEDGEKHPNSPYIKKLLAGAEYWGESAATGTANTFFNMAAWNPTVNGKQVTKGGVGLFQMENDYFPSGWNITWPNTRTAIQIMNPAVE